MKAHRVQVEFGIEEQGDVTTRVVLDGIELTGVKMVSIESDVSGLTEVTIKLIAVVAAVIKAPNNVTAGAPKVLASGA